MGFFSAFREGGFPTQYDEIRWPVTVDVLEAGFICAFLLLAVSYFFILPGFFAKNRLHIFIRVTVSLLIGVFIMLTNFGQEWEVCHIRTRTAYKAGTAHEIDAEIGVKIGLRSVNVTLKADRLDGTPDEMIDYNERFEWTWDQGRFGFGPYSGHLQQSFRAAQRKGLPYPILWIVDYLVVDGEGLRFGRFYRTAGWYAHILQWASFPCWLLANLMFLTVVRYGAAMTLAVGALQLLSCLVWSVVRNPLELTIPFEDDTIALKYGVSYWFAIVVGIVCLLIGGAVIYLDLRYPDEITVFFGIDPLSEYDEVHLTADELEAFQKTASLVAQEETTTYDDIQLHNMEVDFDSGKQQQEQQQQHQQQQPVVVSMFKRRSTVRLAQKSLYRGTRTVDDAPEYYNLPGSSRMDQAAPPPVPGKKPNVQPLPPKKKQRM